MAAAVILTGCESKELVTCRQDNEILQSQAAAIQQELEQTRMALQRKDAEVARIKADNADMQQKAMESIMTMLKKEEERTKTLQTSIALKDEQLKAEADKRVAAEQAAAQALEQVKAIHAELSRQNAASSAQ